MIHGEGKGYVEGVELHRMGQTNVLGRYPMHFHLLENTCHDCYFRHSSVHRSYYRCVSIHGTHNMTVTGKADLRLFFITIATHACFAY